MKKYRVCLTKKNSSIPATVTVIAWDQNAAIEEAKLKLGPMGFNEVKSVMAA